MKFGPKKLLSLHGMCGHAVLSLIMLNKILSQVKPTSFCLRHCPCLCSSGGAQAPQALSLWHLFGLKAERGTGWQLLLASLCSQLSSLLPLTPVWGRETSLWLPANLTLIGKAMKQSSFKKKWSQIQVSGWKNSLFICVGLALIKCIAWSYRHPEFNKANTMKTVKFLTAHLQERSWRLKITSVDIYEEDNPGWDLNYWVLLSV